MAKYITAYDPTIKKRVLFKLVDGWAVSVITGHKFRYKPGNLKQKEKKSSPKTGSKREV